MKTLRTAPILAGVALLALLPASPALGQSSERQPLDLGREAPSSAAASGGGGFLRTVLGLAVVIGVIYALYWVLKKVKASREEQASGSGLAALASLPLGPNRSVHMIRAGREIVLVGASEHGVVPIRSYDEDEARAAGLLDVEVPAMGSSLEPTATTPSPAGPPASFASPQDALRHGLASLRKRTVRQ